VVIDIYQYFFVRIYDYLSEQLPVPAVQLPHRSSLTFRVWQCSLNLTCAGTNNFVAPSQPVLKTIFRILQTAHEEVPFSICLKEVRALVPLRWACSARVPISYRSLARRWQSAASRAVSLRLAFPQASKPWLGPGRYSRQSRGDLRSTQNCLPCHGANWR
jgi:hypothetical protein